MRRVSPRRATVLLADPPWKFGDGLPGKRRGAARRYKCMTTAAIMAFELPPLADDCLLLLWRMAAMQRDALDVVRAWGFVDKTEIVWNKTTKHGKPWFGMGHYTRSAHETCLVCVRGRVKVDDRSVRSTFSAMADKSDPDRKPERIFEIAELLVKRGPYVELFARRTRPGWITLGDQCAGAGA